tara:strand:+ start:2272 stop:3231 length:960 start_codon:yes stop_codon:yes gene_type:complete
MGMLMPSGFRNAMKRVDANEPISILHNHGLWLRTSHDAVSYAARRGIPIIQSPRGMLNAWARRHKYIKKELAWKLYQKRDFMRADVIHATSIAEMECIRNTGAKQPVAVVPNGVNQLTSPLGGEGPNSSEKTLLFLSRIDVVKGIPLLLEAWSQLRVEGWKLVIAGNDYSGHLSEVRSLISSLGIENSVQLFGPAYGSDKDGLFRRADLFVLPSYSENFGIVIAEALQYGLPVITTTGTPWAELSAERCGWWVPPTVDGIRDALDDAVKLSDQQRSLMGERGQHLISEKYLWEQVGSTMFEVYQWMLADGPMPDCVHTV